MVVGILGFIQTNAIADKQERPALRGDLWAGDVNGDGVVDDHDLLRLMQWLTGWNVRIEPYGVDVNGDGEIDDRDILMLMQYLTGHDIPPDERNDFILTISMEETTIKQGGNFMVHIEFKNISGEDAEISSFYLKPHIPGVKNHGGSEVITDGPSTVLFKADSVWPDTSIGTVSGASGSPWKFGYTLTPGTYKLQFRARFFLSSYNESNVKEKNVMTVLSNILTLTVTN